jgi:hypothetical protein
MDVQIFLGEIWILKDKLNSITILKLLPLFCIQWPFIYRNMEIFFQTSFKCEWKAYVGTSSISRAVCALCALYAMLACVDVHVSRVINTHGTLEPLLYIVFLILPN